ncbi:MAG TPA: hypothetical protein VJ760_05710 [Nitrospiraceae bacterium]|nr:hypothetical protein [Nitrospiraceae bacterium]
MSSSDPFESARRRITRAKKHIHNLNRTVKAFLNRKPYRHVIEPAGDGIHEVHKLKAKRRTLPCSFSDIAIDVIENLRAALDHAVYPIAVKVGAPNLDKIYFPFCASANDFRSRVNGSCPGFPKEIVTLLESFKPYQGGNNALWALSEMSKISKHRAIPMVAFVITGMNAHEIRGFGNFSMPPQWDRINNEFILGWTVPNTEARYNARFSFNIGFEDIPIIGRKPLIGILNEMASIVDGILMGLKAETNRIGLFNSGLHSK